MSTTLPYLRANKLRLLRLILNGIGQAAAAIAMSLIVKHVFDMMIGTDAVEFNRAMISLAAMLAAVVAVRAALVYDERMSSERLGQDFAHHMRIKLFDHLRDVPPRRLNRHGRGSMILRLTSDLTPLRQWVALGVARLTVASVAISATLVALAVLDWPLAMLAGVALGVGAGFAALMVSPLEKALRKARRRRGFLADSMSEKLTGMATIQAHGRGRSETRRFSRDSRRVADAMVRRARYLGAIRATGEFTVGLATAATLLFGAWQAASGDTSPGTLAATLTILAMFSGPIRDFERIVEYRSAARVAQRRIDRILRIPQMSRVQSGRAPDNFQIEFADLAINGVAARIRGTVRPGEKIVIAGPPGTGKSTFILALAGLVPANEGRIAIGGTDIREIGAKRLRELIGVVSPELPLMKGSIRRNILYRKPDADTDDVERACADSGLDALLLHLPEGLQTRVGEGGNSLSAGQRRAVALARALLGRPPILLIDDRDAQGDPDASAAVCRLTANYPGTVFIVMRDGPQIPGTMRCWSFDRPVVGDSAAVVSVFRPQVA